MKRTLSSTLIAAAFVVAPACKKDDAQADGAAKESAAAASGAEGEKAEGGEAAEGGDTKEVAKTPTAGGGSGSDPMNALALAPDSAIMVGTADFSILSKVPGVDAGVAAAMMQDPDSRDGYQVFLACGYQISMLSRISFAGSDAKGGLVIIDGKGLSEQSKLQCLADKSKEKEGTTVTFTDGDGYRVGTSDKGDGVVIAIGENRLVITDEKYRAEVEGRIKGEGKSAIEGSLAAAMPLADTSKPVWMVIGASEDLTREMKGMPLEKMTGAGVWFDGALGGAKPEGFDMGVKIGMPDDASATAGKDFIVTQFEQVKPMAGMFGLPPELVNKVKFGTEGAVVTVGLSLDAKDLAQLEAVAKQMGGGMGGMGAMGGMPGGAPGGAPGGMPGGM